MLVIEPVASENGMPAALAARASSSSPWYHIMPAAPVGAMPIGILCSLPKTVVSSLRPETSTSMRGTQLDALERLAVVAQRHFVFGAAVHELEQPLGQAPLGHLPQVENVLRVFHVPEKSSTTSLRYLSRCPDLLEEN